jgi:Fur family ferric uptake transcriptional regulator
VVEALAEQDCCRTALEIHDRLRAGDRAVGIASVYRVLDVLAGLGLVQRVDVGRGIARYEPVPPGGEHHHHVVCDDCGRVDPFVDPGLERAIQSAAGLVGYDVAGHEVVLRGACDDCRATATA